MIWTAHPNYPDYIEVSPTGLVRSIDRLIVKKDGRPCRYIGTVLAQQTKYDGYSSVNLKYWGDRCSAFVHRLVAETYLPNPDNLPCVNHIDGNKQNNHVDNLEWCSYTANHLHATGLWLFRMGERSPSSRLTAVEVLEIVGPMKHYSLTEIAKMYGIERTTASCIRNGKTWSHVTGIPYTRKSRAK